MLFSRSKKETPPSWRYAIPLVVALVVFIAYSAFQNGRWLRAKNDFVAFYLAGQLQPEGKLYDAQAFYDRQDALLGGKAPALVYIRPPFYSLLFVPIAKLPYLPAYLVYQLLQILLLCVWLKMTWRTHPKLVLTAGLSLPLLLALGNGQDVVLVTAMCGIAFQLLERRPFLAGLVLALCSIKAHLFLLVPFALARFGRWKTIGGGLAGGLGLVGLSFVAGGPSWLADYRKILEIKDIDGKINQAGNIRALADAFGMSPDFAPWFLGIGLLGCLWLVLKSETLQEALVYSIAGVLVFNWHSFLQDFTLLLTIVPWVSQMGLSVWGDRTWRLVLSPVPYVAAMPGAPFSALLPLSMLAFLKFSKDRPKS